MYIEYTEHTKYIAIYATHIYRLTWEHHRSHCRHFRQFSKSRLLRKAGLPTKMKIKKKSISWLGRGRRLPSVFICVHICIYITYIYIHTHKHMHTYTRTHTYTHMHVCIYLMIFT